MMIVMLLMVVGLATLFLGMVGVGIYTDDRRRRGRFWTK
jgi:hypothetical protein